MINSNRGRPKKPGEESLLLQVIGELIRHDYSGSFDAGQRIAHFQVRLAIPLDLAGISPRWDWIEAQRIIHPLSYFMAGNFDVQN